MKNLITRLTNIRKFVKNGCNAIIAPNETRACKKADAINKYVTTIQAVREEERKEILFRYEMYKKLGMSDEECKSKILSLLEMRNPNLLQNDVVNLLNRIGTSNGKNSDSNEY